MKIFTIRLTDDENNVLLRLAKKKQTTKNNIIKMLIKKRNDDKKIKRIEKLFEINSEIYLSLTRVTGNINQIAYHLNQGNFVADPKEFFLVARELKEITKIFMQEVKNNQKIMEEVL